MAVLEASGLIKDFGPTRALAGADLTVEAGEIVALMGANGAGKSTLVNIVAGVHAPDGGTIRVGGSLYRPSAPAEAARAGIITVHQSTDRIGSPGLTVADALLLPDYASGTFPFFVSRASVRRRATDVLARARIGLPLDRDFAELGPAERQLVGIARAVAASPRLLILDEPTASLSSAEAERLFAVLGELKGRGLAILYISHRIADLKAIADRVVVLRNGRVVDSQFRPVDFSRAVASMIGRSLEAARPQQRAGRTRPVLQVENLRLVPGAAPIDLAVGEGEVVAIHGPLGAGKSRLLSQLFGALPVDGQATLILEGRAYRPRGPAEAIALGVALAGEDRHRSSLMPSGWPGASLAQTISLPHLARWFPSGLLLGGRETAEGLRAIAGWGIKAAGPGVPMASLSGGNQKKVVLARWQAEPTRLLLLDEPFQGVDIGARADIIAGIRRSGCATLIATSDPEEALEVGDRIHLMDNHALTPATAAAAHTPEPAGSR